MDNAWKSDAPTEPGYYWFYGTTAYMRAHKSIQTVDGRLKSVSDPLPPKMKIVEVRVAGGEKKFTVWISEGGYIYPDNDGYEGGWLKFDPPAPPENVENGVDKVGGKG